ncbi:MAG: diacylglycerol kinase [Nitrospirota bacterium]|nr:diacylglycerol kinase [Nitrospirota bacterium]
MKPKGWLQSANVAIEGILYAARTQKHMRWHLLMALVVIIAGLLLDVSAVEFIALSFAVILVMATEMLNTAVEVTVDMIAEGYHPMAKIAKDVAAGAVFLVSFGAVIIGYLVLYPHVKDIVYSGIMFLETAPEHLTVIALVVVVITVVIVKTRFGKGTPLHGGMPSGHAAVSFSIWMAVVLLTENPLVALITFVLAAMTSHSRLLLGIHSLWEVVAGGILGALITLLIFQLF